MKAGLLADIILGESPHLKGLIRHFNLLVLNKNGRISGFNTQFIRFSGFKEDELINQSFPQLFDSDEGKAGLQLAIKTAFRGQPGCISFFLAEKRLNFRGVVLPVYHQSLEPTSLLVIAKEEERVAVSDTELEDFWQMTQKMMTEAGISTSDLVEKEKTKQGTTRILLVEDSKGLMVRLFRKVLGKGHEELVFAPNAEAALLMARQCKPDILLCFPTVNGGLSSYELSDQFKTEFQTHTIFLSSDGNEIRLEDGWLDIHVKHQPDVVHKILDLIHQMYA